MKRGYSIGIDIHGHFCEAAVLDPRGMLIRRQTFATTIPALVKCLESVTKPRQLVIEEGPLANWLWRHLRDRVDKMAVAEPRRNRLIAKDGDKDDDIDAEKLAHLFWGGFIKEVHQVDTLEEAVFRQHVSLYHGQVNLRVRVGHRIWSLFRRHGVIIRKRDFHQEEARDNLLNRLPNNAVLREEVTLLFRNYDLQVEHEETFRKRLCELAKQNEVLRRFECMPGISWVRATTLYVFLATPWRFRSKQALWKYLGIGLERRRSGNGPTYLGVPKQVNRLLKSTILGAAKSAVALEDNPYAEQYERWVAEGLSPKLARRNVARSMSATLWGLWKNGSEYRPEWVGKASAAIAAVKESEKKTVATA